MSRKHTCLSRLLISFLICMEITVLSLFSNTYAENINEVTIGVLAHRGEQTARQMWEPMARYLETQIPGYHFLLLPLTLEQMNEAVEWDDLDFILTNTGNYVNLEANHSITRIATLKNMRQGRPYTAFGAVILVRADREDIQNLDDLRGKSFAAVSKGAFGGFQMAWRELKHAGIDPFTDFSSLKFMGFPQDNIVKSVRDGKIDAGTVRTDTLERMASSGEIKLDDFRVLNSQETSGFPFLHSTQLYPEWPFARARQTSDEFATRVVIAMLKLSPDDLPSKAGLNAGWTVPLSYQGVHDMFKELKIGPYAQAGKFTLMQIIKQYRYWLILFALILAFAAYHFIRVERLVTLRTMELSDANQALAQHREQLTELVEERTAELKNTNEDLKIEIDERAHAESALKLVNEELNNNVSMLRETQSQLVQAEKMASLGQLVAGFSHELNTPLGIGVTSASYIQDEIQSLSRNFVSGNIRRSDLEDFIEHSLESSDILLQNLRRASELISTFKQVAVDQSSDRWRNIDLYEYIDEIILSLKPKWKRTAIRLVNECDNGLQVFSHPGAIYQILSNLIMNALIYAFDEKQSGQIQIRARREANFILMELADNGKGIDSAYQQKIFDPFFTTRRGSGGSGLGLNIVFNLVTGTLKGTIRFTSSPDEGTVFHIVFPYQTETSVQE